MSFSIIQAVVAALVVGGVGAISKQVAGFLVAKLDQAWRSSSIEWAQEWSADVETVRKLEALPAKGHPTLSRPAQIVMTGCTVVVAAIVSGMAASPMLAALFAATIGVLLLIAATDYISQLITDSLLGALVVLGGLRILLDPEHAADQAIIGGIAGLTIMAALAALAEWRLGRAGVGQGDTKLVAAIGLLLGWSALPAVMFLAAVIGLALMAMNRSRAPIAFGPPICLASGLRMVIEAIGF
ncbi:MAG: A24 family peptidase [Pseudomonadota bacterium]